MEGASVAMKSQQLQQRLRRERGMLFERRFKARDREERQELSTEALACSSEREREGEREGEEHGHDASPPLDLSSRLRLLTDSRLRRSHPPPFLSCFGNRGSDAACSGVRLRSQGHEERIPVSKKKKEKERRLPT